MRNQEVGRLSTWPTRIRRGSRPGLAPSRAGSLTWYWRAIAAGVSPALTVCVLGLPPGTAWARQRSEPEAEPPAASRTAALVALEPRADPALAPASMGVPEGAGGSGRFAI